MDRLPRCFGTTEVRRPQSRAENCCDDCPHEAQCAKHTDTSCSGDLVELKAMLAKCNDSGHDWWLFALTAERDVPVLIDRIEALEIQLESANEALREQLDIREALEAENERLREALGLLSAVELTIPADRIRDDDHVIITYKTFRALRTALERIDHD